MASHSYDGFAGKPGTVDAARVSVVIPAYNAAAFLAATLRGIAEQSAPPGEVIVVDDGSTDATPMLARSFGATLISTPNGGPSAARNAGTKAATGEFIAFLDADDIWEREKLAVQLAALESFGRPAFTFTDYRVFSEHGISPQHSELLRHSAFRRASRKLRGSDNVLIAADQRRAALSDSYIPPSSVIVRRADVLAVGGFDETLRMSEDYEFHLRLLRIVPALVVMRPLLLYRLHPGQATAQAVSGKAGLIEVASRVAAHPERYPSGDATYMARTDFRRQYRLGLQHARLGEFGPAVAAFERSLATRTTVAAAAALLGAQCAQSAAGRRIFDAVRTSWKNRPKRA